jgi:hypothetical protein
MISFPFCLYHLLAFVLVNFFEMDTNKMAIVLLGIMLLFLYWNEIYF